MQPRLLAQVVGNLLLLAGSFMFIPALYALLEGDGTLRAFLLSTGVALVAGVVLRSAGGPAEPNGTHGEQQLRVRTALAAVTLGWTAVSLVGALPFLFSGVLPDWPDAIFEAVSGFTTTGATVIADVDVQPHPVILWRSLLQWLGGMGIVVLFASVFPRIGVGGMQLFRAEVPGPVAEKILPRLSATSKLLWGMYSALTVAAFGMLLLTGIEPFDAINHALATVGTGGFSTRSAGVSAFANPAMEWVLTFIMFLGGTNSLLQYRLFRFGDWRALKENGEFRLYLAIVLGAGGLIGWTLWSGDQVGPVTALRTGLFHAVSITTSTGHVASDYERWSALGQAVLFLLMFVGGSAGSTAGGPKVIRILVVLKHGFAELRRLLHPRSVHVLRVGETNVSERMFYGVAGFLFLYMLIWFVSVVVMAGLGFDLFDGATAAISALSNIGPGFGVFGPPHTYAPSGAATKLYLSFLMLIGRLELLSVLVLFHPAFWEVPTRRRE